MGTRFLNYIHYFRGYTILLIVAVHCRYMFSWGDNILGNKIWGSLLENSTILFVIISGFLFQHLNQTGFQFKVYFQKKLKFVILPYLIVSIPAIINSLFKDELIWMPEGLKGNYLYELGYMIITGKHLGPLWFMPMIFIFYVLSPLIHYLDKPWFYKFIFPFVMLFGLFTFKFGFFSNIPQSFVNFLPIYFYGMFLSRYKDKIFELGSKLYLPSLLVYIVITILDILNVIDVPQLTSYASNEYLPFFLFNPIKLKICLLAIVILNIFHHYENRDIRFLKILGDYSFGIYFVHYYIIIGLKKLKGIYFDGFELNTFTFLLLIVLVSSFSILLVYLIKQLTGSNSRLVVGS